MTHTPTPTNFAVRNAVCPDLLRPQQQTGGKGVFRRAWAGARDASSRSAQTRPRADARCAAPGALHLASRRACTRDFCLPEAQDWPQYGRSEEDFGDREVSPKSFHRVLHRSLFGAWDHPA